MYTEHKHPAVACRHIDQERVTSGGSTASERGLRAKSLKQCFTRCSIMSTTGNLVTMECGNVHFGAENGHIYVVSVKVNQPSMCA